MIDFRKERSAIRESYAFVNTVLAWPDARLLVKVPTVSQWSAGQQLQHVGLVNSTIATQLIQLVSRADEPDSDRRATIMGISVLSSGFIPRGSGRSPARLQPPDKITREDIATIVAHSLTQFDELDVLSRVLMARRGRFAHPYFGYLLPAQWIRFMNVHTSHHIKIVRDIERALPD